MKLYAGIDLHSTNSYIGIIDENAQKVCGKRLDNNLKNILLFLSAFKKELVAIVVESTYNWYWLVDGLQESGYSVHLANPAAIKQYEGIKHKDDKWDSFWLAEMKRLKILPEGYIYPKKERAIRDLLRRRLLFVRQRTAQILSLQSLITRNFGFNFSGNDIKRLRENELLKYGGSEDLNMTANMNISAIHHLDNLSAQIEKSILSKMKLRKEFLKLNTIPGIGKILALTIMLEVGDINRFPKVGNYSSYCRSVSSIRTSNEKKKGKGNTKNGNTYLSWAYVEAANFARRFCPEAQKFYNRKAAKKNGIVATKALSNKISRASYYLMRDNVKFDVEKLFV
jgi:transposase